MLGPSGSGKTTCLMMLAGFETATHGEILLDGKPINNIPPHKRGIGMVFQNYALFPHMTVGENLSFPLEVRGMGKSERERRSSARSTWCRWALRQPPPGAAVGRPAAAHRAGPRAGVRARTGADGRAAGRARQAAARAHAVRDQAHPRTTGHHHGLRHPRPDRGADHVGPVAVFNDGASSSSPRPTISTSGRRTASSPSSSARTTRCDGKVEGDRRRRAPCGWTTATLIDARSRSTSRAGRAHARVDPARAGEANPATACSRRRPTLRGRGAGVHLHGRHLPHPAEGGGQRRIHHEDRNAARPGPLKPGRDRASAGCQEDCRALDPT
jgi:hypothetical protein